jgi:hypothetical protein
MSRVALRIIRDNPFFGVGLGNYEHVMYRYDVGPEYAHKDFIWPVHNIYLNITAEGGLLGGLFFLLTCITAIWHGIRATRAPDPFLQAAAIGLVTGLIGFLLVGMKELGPLGAPEYRLFWLTIGLLVAIGRLGQETPAPAAKVQDPEAGAGRRMFMSRRKRLALYGWRGLEF